MASDEAKGLMARCTYGVLATVCEAGQPYAVPLSYVFQDDCIYFHCAMEGHKIDNIRANPAVSFCVVGQTQTLPNKFSTEYESAVAFGVAQEIFDGEKEGVLQMILNKYSPDFPEKGSKYMVSMIDKTAVFMITVNHLSGKARR